MPAKALLVSWNEENESRRGILLMNPGSVYLLDLHRVFGVEKQLVTAPFINIGRLRRVIEREIDLPDNILALVNNVISAEGMVVAKQTDLRAALQNWRELETIMVVEDGLPGSKQYSKQVS